MSLLPEGLSAQYSDVEQHLSNVSKDLESAKGFQTIDGVTIWKNPGKHIIWKLFSWLPYAEKLFGIVRVFEVERRLNDYQIKVVDSHDPKLIGIFNTTVRNFREVCPQSNPLKEALIAPSPELLKNLQEAWRKENLDSKKPIKFSPDWRMDPAEFHDLLKILQDTENRTVDVSDCPWITKEHLATLKDIDNVIFVNITGRKDLKAKDIPIEVRCNAAIANMERVGGWATTQLNTVSISPRGVVKFDPNVPLSKEQFEALLSRIKNKIGNKLHSIDLDTCSWVTKEHLPLLKELRASSREPGIFSIKLSENAQITKEDVRTIFSEMLGCIDYPPNSYLRNRPPTEGVSEEVYNRWLEQWLARNMNTTSVQFDAEVPLNIAQFESALTKLAERKSKSPLEKLSFIRCSWMTEEHLNKLNLEKLVAKDNKLILNLWDVRGLNSAAERIMKYSNQGNFIKSLELTDPILNTLFTISH
ncbi:MAG: hypothetical protein P4L16_05520 [Chlamydiales bacterium]|nr:hypothetical protein [Chlamydiales bacterium]